jgi:hypothetical protein
MSNLLDQLKSYLPVLGSATVLFVFLAPGLLLSLPATPKSECRLIAPLPTGTVGACEDGEFTGSGTANDVICAAQKKCNSLTLSKTVGVGTVFVHAFVFLLLMFAIQYSMDMAKRYGYFSGGFKVADAVSGQGV